jgi:hypothetical protein
MNQFVLDHLDPPEHWRSTAVAIDTPKDLSGSLPYWVCYGEFVCWKGIQNPQATSQLNYIWFIDSPDGVSIRELITTAFANLDWEDFFRGKRRGDVLSYLVTSHHPILLAPAHNPPQSVDIPYSVRWLGQ